MNLARLTPETQVSPLPGLRHPGGRLLLPCLFSLRAQLPAPALATTGRAHRVAGVALHADHLEQPAALGLREAGHRGRDARAVYNAFGRRGLCFTETDLITTRFGRRGSRGGLARLRAWTMKA